jgi:uncharacterized protein YacL
MDRPIKLSEMIGIFFTFIVALLTLGYNYGTKTANMQQEITTNSVRISEVEKTQREDKQEINKKLDGMTSTLIDIRLLLQEKQDRKR